MPATKIAIPKTAKDVTLEWLNLVMNPHQIHVEEFAFMGDAKSDRGNLSDLNRLKLQIRKGPKNLEEMSVVIKTMPSDGNIRAFTASKGYGPNEVQMYTKVIPAINEFLDSRNISKSNSFNSTKCYYGQEEEGESTDEYNFILVLEDLVASKHKFWDQGAKQSFDWVHASAAIRSLALFHAASTAYKIAKGFGLYEEEFPRFIKHSIEDPALDIFIKSGFQATREVLLEDEVGVPEGLLERLEKLEENFKPIMEKMSVKFDGRSVNVIRHSDLHFFNVAFSEDTENGIEAKWFDFQNCSEGRPMTDLAFLLMLNCEPEFSTVKLDESLSLYHQIFTGVLNEAKIDLNYTFETMKEEFSRYRLPSILHIISGSPIWSCGPNCNSISRERLRRAIIYAYEIGELDIPVIF